MGDKDGLTRKEFLSSLGKGILGAAACAAMAGGQGQAAQAAPAEAPLPFSLVKTGTLDPGLEKPLGVAIDARDNLYAAGAAGVKVFSAEGRLLRTLKTSEAAVCVAVAEDGAIYAGLRARIEKFDESGSRVAAWGEKGDAPGQLRFVTGIAASERYVYVTDAQARKIHRFATDGDYIDQIDGPEDGHEKGFLIPSGYFDCKLDAKGILYVGHTGMHRVERYDTQHKLAGAWGKFGNNREDFCGCCNPTNIALMGDGRVVTAEKGVPRLKVYDGAGKLLACLNEKEFPGNAAGMALAVDSRGRIALVEPITKTIRFYEMRKA